MKSAKRVNPVLVIFTAALVLRVVAIAIAWLFHRYPQPLEYEVVVSNWLEGKGFVYFHYGAWYSSFLNPLYAFLCIAVYKLFGHYHLLILLMQAIFTGLLRVCIFYIGCRIDRRIGIVAALLTMVHPGIFYYDVFYLHPLSMDAFLFALIILVFVRLAERGIFMNQLAAGLAIGVQMYERGTIAFFVPLAMVWLKYFSSFFKDSITRWLKKCAVMTVVAILLLLPWTIRNFVIHKELVPVCTTIAEVLWRGNNPLATGTAYAANGKPMFFAAPKEFQKRLMALDEMGQTRVFHEEAIAFIRQSPPRFIHLTLKKMMLFWWFSPLTGIEYKFAYLGIVKLAYAVMMVISLMGMIFMIARRTHVNLAFLMLIMFFTVTLGQSFFYVQQKHRWELEPLLFIFTSSAIVYCYDSLFNRKGLLEK